MTIEQSETRNGRSALRSVFVRCAGIMAVTTVVVACVLAVTSTRLIDGLARQGVQDQVAIAASAEAQNLVNPIRFNAAAKVQEALANAMTASGDMGVAVIAVDGDGETLGRDGDAQQVGPLQSLAQAALQTEEPQTAQNGLWAAKPIRAAPDGPILGAVALAYDDAQAMAQVAAKKRYIAFWAAGVFAVMMFLTLVLLRHTLGTPLNRLANEIAGVAEGDYDLDGSLLSRRDEIGGIAALGIVADGPGNRPRTGVIGGECQQPVAIEALGQGLQVIQSGVSGRQDVASAVVPPSLGQPVVSVGLGYELP